MKKLLALFFAVFSFGTFAASVTDLQKFDTVYAMVAYKPTGTNVVTVSGYTTPGDGGGGQFYFDTASVASTNLGTVFASAAGGTGRWIRRVVGDVTPQMFGARENGSTDDTAAINAAITYVNGKGGGRVIFLPGTYDVTGAGNRVQLLDNVSLLGHGTVLQISSAPASSYIVINGNLVTNVAVHGFTISGYNAAAPGGNTNNYGHGVRLSGVTGAIIEDVISKNLYYDGFYVGLSGSTTSHSITFNRVHSISHGRNGISITRADGVIVQDSVFEGATGVFLPSAGIDVEPNSGDTIADVKFVNSLFQSNSGTGLLIQRGAGGLLTSGVEVIGCTSRLNGGSGISLAVIKDVSLVGNNCISNGVSGIGIASGCTNITVSANKCSRNGTRGIYVSSGGGKISITGNIVRDNGDNGIEATPGTSSPISQFSVANNIVSGNIDGIHLRVSGASITGNTITFNQHYGINLVPGLTENTTITGNFVAENSQAADNVYDNMILWGDRATVMNNIVRGSLVYHSGTASAGASGSITLDATASATSTFYDGQQVELMSGTGIGQVRIGTNYVGSTKVLSVTTNWTTPPDNTSVYEVRSAIRPHYGISIYGVSNIVIGNDLYAAGKASNSFNGGTGTKIITTDLKSYIDTGDVSGGYVASSSGFSTNQTLVTPSIGAASITGVMTFSAGIAPRLENNNGYFIKDADTSVGTAVILKDSGNNLRLTAGPAGDLNMIVGGVSGAFMIKSGGTVGIGTPSPGSGLNLAFLGDGAKTIGINRSTGFAVGRSLNINAGGTTSAGTNVNGGDLILQSGVGTGTGTSAIYLKSNPAGSTGTTDTTPTIMVTVDGTGINLGTAGTRFKSVLSATAALNFGSILAAASADLAIAVTGAAVNDSVALGLPAAPDASIVYNAFVSASDTVTVRAFNVGAIADDPPSATYRVTVTHF